MMYLLSCHHKSLWDSSHVFLRQDTVHRALEPPYSGPHHIIARTDKTLQIVIQGRHITVSADRVKPTYLLGASQHDTNNPPAPPSNARQDTNSAYKDHIFRAHYTPSSSFHHLALFSTGGDVGTPT